MSITPDTRSNGNRVAVFIDFDNVEIGVKSTIGGQFDIGLVLEAIKERGEIVTKIAYSDWKRAGDYSRILTQHAIRMVQRNLTPGGDKNGADITMALDALEECDALLRAHVEVMDPRPERRFRDGCSRVDERPRAVDDGGRARESAVERRRILRRRDAHVRPGA